MLSDEEKQAVKIVKGITEDDLLNYWEGPEEPYNAIQTLLNLIEKQSKEIEANKGYHLGFIDGGIAKRYEYEDKIKAKIEEEDKLFFKTKDVRHANRYKAYKELLEKE